MKKILLILLLGAFGLCSSLKSMNTPWLTVVGNHLEDSAGNKVVLRGISTINVKHLNTFRPGYKFVIDKISEPNMFSRIIRLPVYPADFQSNSDDLINNHLKPAIEYCKSKGLYAIIDWHYIADASTKDAETKKFWNRVAPIFKDYSNVFYEIFNENSSDMSWATWKSVCQPWIDIIRSHAPKNLILAGGPHYAQNIKDAATNPFTGENIAYVAHFYPGGYYRGGYEAEIGVVANNFPVFITEFGFGADSPNETTGTVTSFGNGLKTFVENHGTSISWTAWVADYAWFPAMFWTDWTLKEGGDYMGGFTRDWLYEKRNSYLPTPSGTVAVTGISLNQTAVSLSGGNTTTLVATILPSNATNNNVVWTSGNTTVATVYNDVVTGVTAGSAVITAASAENSSIKATCTVTVTSTPSTVTYQAESSTAQSGTSISTGFAGYTGTGFVDYGGNGTYIEWNNINSANANSSVTLSFVFANGGTTNRQCAVSVNGVDKGNVSFAPTGAWTTWSPITINVPLNAGNNTVRVTANTTDGGPNLDKMYLESGQITTSNINSTQKLSLIAYPNPAVNVVNLQMQAEGTSIINIYTMDGKLVFNKTVIGNIEEAIQISEIGKGMFVVKVISESEIQQLKIVLK